MLVFYMYFCCLQRVSELEEAVQYSRREGDGLLERLDASKSTMLALERELAAKESRYTHVHMYTYSCVLMCVHDQVPNIC